MKWNMTLHVEADIFPGSRLFFFFVQIKMVHLLKLFEVNRGLVTICGILCMIARKNPIKPTIFTLLSKVSKSRYSDIGFIYSLLAINDPVSRVYGSLLSNRTFRNFCIFFKGASSNIRSMLPVLARNTRQNTFCNKHKHGWCKSSHFTLHKYFQKRQLCRLVIMKSSNDYLYS